MTGTKMDKKKYIQIEFDRQWKGVVQDYSLIASIFMTPDKESKKLVKAFVSTVNLHDYMERLYTPFIDMGTATQISVRLSDCINNLQKGLGRAETYEEGQAAMDRFSACWQGKIDKEKVR